MSPEELKAFLGDDLNINQWDMPEYTPELLQEKPNLKQLKGFLLAATKKLSLNSLVSLLGLEPKTLLEIEPRLSKGYSRVQTIVVIKPKGGSNEFDKLT